jgi:uncharacterized membrane protein YedE/YeeE
VTDPSVAWKLVFFSVFALLSNTTLGPYFTDDERLGNDPSIPIVSVYGYLLGGLFVGFGAKLGNGCTTGHGICGMARLSKRSIISVCTFMTSSFVMFAVVSPDNKAFSSGTAFLRTDEVPELYNRWLGFGISMIVVVPTLYALYALFDVWKAYSKAGDKSTDDTSLEGKQDDKRLSQQSTRTFIDASLPFEESVIMSREGNSVDCENPTCSEISEDCLPTVHEEEVNTTAEQETNTEENEDVAIHIRKLAPAALSSAFFAVGLSVGGMVLPSKLLGFLSLYTIAQSTYDPTLLCVMIGGVVVSLFSYQFVKGWGVFPNNPYARQCPFVAKKFSVPTNNIIDWQLLTGAVCFGVGWALGGLCPGPAMFLAATGTKPVIICWWPGFIAGSFLAQKIKDRA